MASWLVCLVVLITLKEFEIVSDTTDELNPMNACLSSIFFLSWYFGNFSLRTL